jgi:hypothetical protein
VQLVDRPYLQQHLQAPNWQATGAPGNRAQATGAPGNRAQATGAPGNRATGADFVIMKPNRAIGPESLHDQDHDHGRGATGRGNRIAAGRANRAGQPGGEVSKQADGRRRASRPKASVTTNEAGGRLTPG